MIEISKISQNIRLLQFWKYYGKLFTHFRKTFVKEYNLEGNPEKCHLWLRSNRNRISNRNKTETEIKTPIEIAIECTSVRSSNIETLQGISTDSFENHASNNCIKIKENLTH